MNTEDLSEGFHSSNMALNDVADELGWQVVNPNLTTLKRIDIGDVELTYIEHGRGPLIVLVHGSLGDCRTWSRQVALLAQHYHVISYSRRYHHLNPSPGGPIDYSYRRHVDDLISLMRSLELGPAHLVGHSYGATVAALAALERPEMVSSLVLGEPSLFSILSEYQDRVSLRFHRIALRGVQKLSENDERGLAVREYLKIVVGRDVYDELSLEDLLVINQNAHTLSPMLQRYFEPTRLDRSSAQNLTIPTLLITGELSPGIYGAISRELNNSLPAGESFNLPGASHGLQMENPVGFGSAVLQFLTRTSDMVTERN
ncbi:MAG TPA: alpha/beta hydrolase [Pyrinomonadaceae bacterium]|nr:alpha/beta hydrolase [Pyrinomonadaceae bacterium]